ncbi:MAG: DUF4331 family protein, partial [Verrucomicrobiia bacterium]
RWLTLSGLLAATIVVVQLGSQAADHRDGPIFVNTQANGRADINDAYIFQAPGNANHTVMIFTVSPFAGNLTPTTFDQNLVYDFKIDNTGDAIENITFRVTFGPPNTQGVQTVTVRGLPLNRFPPTGRIARGNTGTNIPVTGGGLFRAAVHDDPFFFDAAGFNAFIAEGKGSPNRGAQAKNFFGPNANTLAMILQIPTSRIRSSPSNPNVGVWVTTTRNGVQQDRTGRPAINTALIPPIPRNSTAFGERRNAFNAGLPRNDRRDFRSQMITILNTVYGRPRDTSANPPLTSADGLANFLLPDILTFDTSTVFTTNPNDANGFPNGRRLRDDVIDLEYSLLTGGAITTDSVSDDNGDRITDGTRRPNGTLRPIAFPYLGPPNNPAGGPNP